MLTFPSAVRYYWCACFVFAKGCVSPGGITTLKLSCGTGSWLSGWSKAVSPKRAELQHGGQGHLAPGLPPPLSWCRDMRCTFYLTRLFRRSFGSRFPESWCSQPSSYPSWQRGGGRARKEVPVIKVCEIALKIERSPRLSGGC